ncbi:uncharacterized protein LOC143475228 isoform X1 [Brachyhypopomus gauderio]|uniref:uncharacterized protein LOC143475228 isoform X1 n=1 Tax=Brachyhypopomus gauderio TaxID=698409 RepID=UPI004041DEA3
MFQTVPVASQKTRGINCSRTPIHVPFLFPCLGSTVCEISPPSTLQLDDLPFTMEGEDPIAAKFKTLIESVMVKTTADIVKVFTEVLLETRVEISCSWREIDDLKQQLQESEEQRKHTILRHQVTCSLKKDDGGMSGVTHPVSISDTSNKPEGRGSKCGWNVHKRTHANSDHSQNAQDAPKPSQTLTGPKELHTKVEVRMERISDAHLEAALSPKGSLLRDETTSLSSLDVSANLPTGVKTSVLNRNASAPSTCTNMNTPVLTEESPSQSMTKVIEECTPSTSTIGMDKNVKGADIQTASAQIQPEEDGAESDSLTAQNMASVECENGSSTKGANSSLRKEKKSDCNHGVHKDAFPVEKILGWRNAKGKNEVKVKWMPCSLWRTRSQESDVLHQGIMPPEAPVSGPTTQRSTPQKDSLASHPSTDSPHVFILPLTLRGRQS